MLLNAVNLMMLFPVVLVTYYLIQDKSRCGFLLTISCLLYVLLSPAHILLMFICIVVDYTLACFIESSKRKSKRKLLVTLSILFNLSLLIIFKYFNFFSENMAQAAEYLHFTYSPVILHLLVPIGISFQCLRSMSYTLDVYRGVKSAEHDLGRFALYVLFFPQLFTGPIERSKDLISQFYWPHRFYARYVTHGLFLMLWGSFKAFVVADRLALFVAPVFSRPEAHTGVDYVAATVVFSFQLYYLLSGFSDIAFGCAKCFGYHTTRNFNRPYLALSIHDFWKRWNYSLFYWFKDYVWKPAGGNAFIAFVLLGLWHGASWNLLFWGALHGLYVSLFIMSRPIRAYLSRSLHFRSAPLTYRTMRRLLTFSAVCFAWIFFRANSMEDAFYMVLRLGTGWDQLGSQSYVALTGLVCLIFAIETAQWINRHGKIRAELFQKPSWVRYALYYGLILIVVLFGNFNMSINFLGDL